MSITRAYPVWLGRRSLSLDVEFLKASTWPLSKRAAFLAMKYALILKHSVSPFRFGTDHAAFDGRTVYYDSKYGFANYQSILARHQKLIRLAGISEARTIIDIGANVGYFSMLCRDLFPTARIHALEPVPLTFRCLAKNLADDARVELHELALSDVSGIVRMSFDPHDPLASRFSDDGDVSARVDTLDRFVAQHAIDRIDILKIDAETFEGHILRGARTALSLTHFLFIEIELAENPNYTWASLSTLLFDDSYDYQLVGFRNYADVSSGLMPSMDGLFVNTKWAPAART